MKKVLIVSLNVLVILILSKYLFASYKISYKLNNYSISTNYKNNRYYFEIEDNKKRKFNFDMYKKKFNITVTDVTNLPIEVVNKQRENVQKFYAVVWQLNEEDVELTDDNLEIETIFYSEPKLYSVDSLIILKFGPYSKLIANVSMDKDLSLLDVYNKMKYLEDKIKKVNKIKYYTIHVDPYIEK